MKSTGLHDLLDAAFMDALAAVHLAEGETLFAQGDPGDAMYLVQGGRLQALVARDEGGTTVVGEIGPGEPVGEMQLLVGGRRTATVVALTETTLRRVPDAELDRLAADYPAAFEHLVGIVRQRIRRNQVLTRLPNLIGSLSEATLEDLEARLEWIHLQRGERLIRQGEAGDAMYLVVSGRLQAVVEAGDGAERVVGEVAPGESVGEMSMLSGEPRSASVYALRDSVLVKIAQAAFEDLIVLHPALLRLLTRVVTRRLRQTLHAVAAPRKVATIAVVPVHPGAPHGGFAERLVHALSPFGAVLHLSAERLDRLFGARSATHTATDTPHDLRILAWLDEQEGRHRFVVFETDPTLTPWTLRCLRQADRIVLVARADVEARLGPVEAALHRAERPIPQILALLHDDGSRLPSGTRRWLAGRGLETHVHVRGDRDADVDRLARLLADRAVGLVLGGGGARGFAHIGVLRALREAGVPVDLLGGTSMGAFIAAQAAFGWDAEALLRVNRAGFVEAKPFGAYALPVFSLVSNRRLDRETQRLFGETGIEDLWINSFFISSALNTAEVVVHEEGLIWKALRASAALPGIIQPVMQGGRLHVDGALLNNLPVDVMRARCSGQVIVVDVSAAEERGVLPPAPPTPWQYLRSRLLPSQPRPDFPTLIEVLIQSTFLGGAQRAKTARQEADLYLRPPVASFGHLAFADLDELAEIGYRYAREHVAAWLAASQSPDS